MSPSSATQRGGQGSNYSPAVSNSNSSSFNLKGPSLADAALGRIGQGTEVLAEGGYEKIFRQTCETVPKEQLQNSYACYLSTSAAPVMGILYLSTENSDPE